MNEIDKYFYEQYKEQGEKVGFLLGKIIYFIVSIFKKGIFTACKQSRKTLIIYLCLLVALPLFYLIYGDLYFILSLLLFFMIFSYARIFILEYPAKKLRRLFNKIFEEINFTSVDKKIPFFLFFEKLSEYATKYVFRTTIPLNEWKSKQELLAMYINLKIIDIKQHEIDNGIIYMIVENTPLPQKIDWDDCFIESNSLFDDREILTIGVSYKGIESIDLTKYPHMFIAGETGSGKSNILKCLIYQSIKKGYEVQLIDFKRGVSFSSFSEIVKISYDYDTAIEVLNKMVEETKRRLDLFRENKVDNLHDYNNNFPYKKLKRQILFIDELAELLKVRDKEMSKQLYDSIETLTRLSRAVGIHLIMGIQRPDSGVINGQIKNNVSYRLCGRFVDKEPSRIMLNSDIASGLPNIKGRFIARDNELTEIQCFCYYDVFSDSLNYNMQKETDTTVDESSLKAVESPKSKEKSSEDIKVSNEIIFDFNDINN